jgi:adenylosuccinate synthase
MLHAGDLGDPATVAAKLRAIRDLKIHQLHGPLASLQTRVQARFSLDTLFDISWIDAAVDTYAELARRITIVDESGVQALLGQSGPLIFEGAQGVLLDESFGFDPHTTWSTTTFANAQTLLDDACHAGPRTRVGVLRTYFTRHGPGPLVTEDIALCRAIPELHNDPAGWQGRFRVGVFDAVAARYAIAVAGTVDLLAFTHLDRLAQLPARICNAYEAPQGACPADANAPNAFFTGSNVAITDILVHRPADPAHQQQLTQKLRQCRPIYTDLPSMDAEAFMDRLQQSLQSSIGLTSFGPTAQDKQIRAAGSPLFTGA